MPGMWPAVYAAFPRFITNFEGRVPWPYLDEINLITCAIGFLSEPFGTFSSLPWYVDNRPATRAEMLAGWNALRANPQLAGIGGAKPQFERLTPLRLRPDDIDELTRRHFESDEAVLVARHPTLETWPADAQLCLASMSWAMGPHFEFPIFAAACARLDFRAAAEECRIKNGRAARNAANRQLLLNADKVIRRGLPLDGFFDMETPLAVDVTDDGRDRPIYLAPSPIDAA